MKFIKSIIVLLVLMAPAIIFFNSCNDDEIRGFKIINEDAEPPKILSANGVIKNCIPPYPVSFSQEAKNLFGNLVYEWDFGDGAKSNDMNPNHLYSTNGDYQIRLTISNEVGADTAYFKIDALNETSIPVEVDFDYALFNNRNFAPAKVVLYNNSIGANQFQWRFGDGGESKEDNPDYIFNSAGNYNIELEGFCTNGTKDQVQKQVIISPPPQRVYVDRIRLSLEDRYRRNNIFVEMYHNTTYVGSTKTKSFKGFPGEFYAPDDFIDGYNFDFVQFTGNEVFKFIIYQDMGQDPPLFIDEIVLASVQIQNNFYPDVYYQIETVPPKKDVFIDLYLSY
jgi:hypothetical protein